MAAGKTREIKITIPEEFFTLFLPETTHEHVLRAKKEILLAIRSVIDMKIESLETKGGKKADRKKKIKVE